MEYYDWLLQRKCTSLYSQETRQRYVGKKNWTRGALYLFIKGLQINLYLEQAMEIQLFAKFFQRRK
jgi:hypothetical protein